MKRYLLYHFPWQFMMIAIFIQSSIRDINLPDLHIDWTDKLLHFIGFGILGIFIARSLVRMWPGRYHLLTFLIGSIYAASDEIHQHFIPGRSATYGDWIADTLGILFFATAYHFLFGKKLRLHQNRLKQVTTGR